MEWLDESVDHWAAEGHHYFIPLLKDPGYLQAGLIILLTQSYPHLPQPYPNAESRQP